MIKFGLHLNDKPVRVKVVDVGASNPVAYQLTVHADYPVWMVDTQEEAKEAMTCHAILGSTYRFPYHLFIAGSMTVVMYVISAIPVPFTGETQ